MLDLVELLKPSESAEQESAGLSSVLFYQTEVCRGLVEEAFTFEGLIVPKLLENQDEIIVTPKARSKNGLDKQLTLCVLSQPRRSLRPPLAFAFSRCTGGASFFLSFLPSGGSQSQE